MSESLKGAALAQSAALSRGQELRVGNWPLTFEKLLQGLALALHLHGAGRAASSRTGYQAGRSGLSPCVRARRALEKPSFSLCWSEVCLQHRIVPRPREMVKFPKWF